MSIKSRFLDNTGFSNNANVSANRLSNKDGSYNVRKIGIPALDRYSVIHTLLKMRKRHFILLIFAFYFLVNTFFASIYFLVGVEDLHGVVKGKGNFHDFIQAFFFSAQTITTVGYGHVHPTSFAMNILAALESFTGILTFAVITGLIYGRFSKVEAYLAFSDNALITKHNDGTALMFRLSSYKNNNLTNVSAQVILSMIVNDNHNQFITRFFQLPLEIDKINTLATSWTIVHQITQDSPLFGLSHHDLMHQKAEILVQIQGLDDHVYQTVQQKTSYIASEFIFNAKFVSIIDRSTDGTKSVVDLGKLSKFEHFVG